MGVKKISKKKEELVNYGEATKKALMESGNHISVRSALVHCRRMIAQINQIKDEDLPVEDDKDPIE